MAAFAFSHTWRVNAAPDVVFDVLADVDGYPRWWPQVKSVERIDESSGRAVVRSLLPYRLHLVMTREIEDRGSGVLRVQLAEDLIGFARFTVPPPEQPERLGRPGPIEIDYQQVVEIGSAPLRRVSGLVAPVLRANHTAMMLSGESGLQAACADLDRRSGA